MTLFQKFSEANPGLPRGATTPELLFGIIFAENCVEMKKKWTERRVLPSHLLDPPLIVTLQTS